jgi:tRNA-2-methylthio-N6-dimethylallyladenosine synthase
MAEEEIICPGINLPIQSGSDRVLKLMNRGYDVATYATRVESIRRALPDVAVTSDLIVGFPGETEKDFQDSVDALERFRFDLVHSAAYSPRPGTKAAEVQDQLPREEKRRRLQIVNDVQSRIAREINAGLVGREFSILIDGPAPKGEGLVQGRTPSDKVVILEGGPETIGTFVRAEITSADNWSLRGRILSGSEGRA